MAYDFIEEKPSSRFWGNLKEIIAVAGGCLRVARIVKALAELYGADVRWYAAF